MQQTINQQPFLRPTLDAFQPTFKIFMACEDQSALNQARKVQQQVETLCDGEAEVTRALWSFALLRHEQLRAYAAAEAANAEMIVISLRDGAELPSHLKAFLATIPARSHAGQGALVLLLGAPGANRLGRQSVTAYLREVAESRRLDFFCNQDKWSNFEFSRPSMSEPERPAGERFNLISRHIPWSFGGIND